MIELMEHQKEAINNLHNGAVLYGEVGIGKSATVLGYYLEKEAPRDIIVITTAKKRDSGDWIREAAEFGISPDVPSISLATGKDVGHIIVESWNNIGKFRTTKDAFFVFDEQRVIGKGLWVKSFIDIARQNRWVLLSATPGDVWKDYGPVFVANGFFKNLSTFEREHILYEPFLSFPKIKGYIGERKLEMLRNHVLVEMPYLRDDKQRLNFLPVAYDVEALKKLARERWHPTENRPIKDAAELWRLMRTAVNSDPSRLEMIKFLMTAHPRLIVFYNFNYELFILRSLVELVTVAEWNGHKHQPIPDTDRWVYLVQYVAGAEGWNCVTTDAMVLYSLSYSYRNFVQARGRIDRLDSPFDVLYYYILVSNSSIDAGIRFSMGKKQDFNEKKYLETKDGKKALVY